MINMIITTLVITLIFNVIISLLEYKFKKCFWMSMFHRFGFIIISILVIFTLTYACNRYVSSSNYNLKSEQQVKHKLIPLNFVDIDSLKNYVMYVSNDKILISYLQEGSKEEKVISVDNVEIHYDDKCTIDIVTPIFKNGICKLCLGKPIVNKSVRSQFNYYIINVPEKSVSYLLKQ